MSSNCLHNEELSYLNQLIGMTICYGIKSPDMDLYDLGFGGFVNSVCLNGERTSFPAFALHVTCQFKVIYRNENTHVEYYDPDTPAYVFESLIEQLKLYKICRVALSSKNDLWLDFGAYWVVFITYENGEESWRFLTSSKANPHLVASDKKVEWVY